MVRKRPKRLLMCDEKDCGLREFRLEQGNHPVCIDRIKAARHFVEKQDVRFDNKSPQQRKPLLFTAGKLCRPVALVVKLFFEMVEVCGTEQFLRCLFRDRFRTLRIGERSDELSFWQIRLLRHPEDGSAFREFTFVISGET